MTNSCFLYHIILVKLIRLQTADGYLGKFVGLVHYIFYFDFDNLGFRCGVFFLHRCKASLSKIRSCGVVIQIYALEQVTEG